MGALYGTPSNFVAFDRSDTFTFPGNIDGVGGVRQIGPGTLILTGTNTYSGGTTVSAGTLQLGNGRALGFGGPYLPGQAAGTATVTSGGTLDLSGGTVNQMVVLNGGSLINSKTATSARLDNGVASITYTGGLGLSAVAGREQLCRLSGGGGASATISLLGLTAAGISLSGGSGYAIGNMLYFAGGGGTAMSAYATSRSRASTSGGAHYGGSFDPGGAAIRGSRPRSLNVAGYGTGSGASFSFTDGISAAVALTTTAPGSGYTSAPAVGISSGTLAATANLSSLSLVGTNNQIGGAGNLTIPAVISGSGGGFAKIGGGTLTLSGSNTYTGGTTISAGTLQLGTGVAGADSSLASASILNHMRPGLYASRYGDLPRRHQRNRHTDRQRPRHRHPGQPQQLHGRDEYHRRHTATGHRGGRRGCPAGDNQHRQ